MLKLEQLEILADSLQIMTYLELMSQANNNDLLKELQNQNAKYLEKAIEQNNIIIQQNKEIIERLENGNKTNI